MITRLDPTSSEPLFQQLVNSVKSAVATGRMRPGDKLPSVRELAKDLVVNPNTVARAFQVLDADGVTYSRRGSGTFVAEPRPTLRKDEGLRRHRAALDALLSDAVHMGLSEDDVRATFESALGEMRFPAGGEEEGE